MKKIFFAMLVLAVTMIFNLANPGTMEHISSALGNASKGVPITVKMDGKTINCDTPPILFNGSTLVPIRNIAEKLGAKITWDANSSRVNVYDGATSITFKLNSQYVIVNGRNFQMPVRAKVANGRTMIPVRFISEHMGLKVEWDAKRRIVQLRHPNQAVEQLSEEKESGKKVLGFTLGNGSSYRSILKNWGNLDEVATATHTTDGFGNITGSIPESQLSLLKEKKIPASVLITNNFDENVARSLLGQAENRKRFVENLIKLLERYPYSGANIDLEFLNCVDRDHFTTFMEEVYTSLHARGYTVAVSVPAKTYDNPKDSWSGAYDYAALSKYVDEFIIMTYEEHYPGGSPGSIASIGWVSDVIRFAKTLVPDEKIYMGLCSYGYDWSSIGNKALTIDGCIKNAKLYGATILLDGDSKTPHYDYLDENGVHHSVWFENEESLGYKLQLVKDSGISGVGIWRLGLENEEYWQKIADFL